ncbi:MAG: FtsH protease activity modulator HflK [Chromatiales bacterium]|jgi:membrane protease subunit HflK
MPWNEPGGNNKDPWSGGRGGDKGPPDLDELLKKLTGKFGGIFGGGGGGDGGGTGGGRGSSIGLAAIIVVVLLAWGASGFYIISEGERGVVLRLGQFQAVTAPGLHWHIPYPIETMERVDVDQVRSSQHRATMLTQDENIIDIDISVQYRVKDAENYLFEVRTPDVPNQQVGTLYQVMESAVREVVGKSSMDFILSEGRAEVAQATRTLTQEILDSYKTGLEVVTVNLQQAQPPEPVQGSFEDAIKAREDEVRFRNEAEAYANSVIPEARGQAARLEEEATAYKERVIAEAEGNASRFEQLLVEYQKAPRVTRERLYLDTMESVLTNSSMVVVDVEGGNNLLYLPLDRIISEQGRIGPGGLGSSSGSDSMSRSADAAKEDIRRRGLRSREVR